MKQKTNFISAVLLTTFSISIAAYGSGIYIPPPPPYGRKKAEEAPCAPNDTSERCVKQRAAAGKK